MKFKSLLFVIVSTLLVLNVSADTNKDFFTLDGKGVIASRVIHLPGSDTTRGDVHYTIKLALDVDGAFQVIGVGRSGDSFTDQWDTFANGSDSYNPSFNLRNLYVQKTFAEKYQVQLGSIPVENGILRSGGFWAQGWIDGVRGKADTGVANVSITAGSVTDLGNPSVFERDVDFNYVEIKVSRKFFNALLIEAAYEEYEDVSYFKGGVNYDWKIDSERMVKLILEYVASSDGGYKSVVGVESDFYQLITGKKSDIKVRVSWQHVDEDFDLSARPATSFWTQPGDTVMVEASGPLKKEWGLSWYTQFRVNKDPDKSYYIGGVKKSIDFNGLWNKGKSLFKK